MSKSFVLGDDAENSHPCVICKETEYKGVQYGGKGGAIALGDKWIHAICERDNIRLLKCKDKILDYISFDPLSDGWYFYNYNDEMDCYDHYGDELIYCPLCGYKLADHPNILEKDNKKGLE